MPFSLFFAVMPPNGGDGEKQPIYASVSVLKPGKITVQKMVKISILMNHDFLLAYMGVFWSNATPVFSTVACCMTRMLKTVFGSEVMLIFSIFPPAGKMVKFIFFPVTGNFGL